MPEFVETTEDLCVWCGDAVDVKLLNDLACQEFNISGACAQCQKTHALDNEQ